MAPDPTFPSDAQQAVHRIQSLARRLGQPASATEALAELRALAEAARGRGESDPLRLVEIELAVGLRRERLSLLILPSIFAPEDWAFTFLEGLLKVPLDEYAGKRIVEVGSGSGWVAIALARLAVPAHVLGVDLNPHAAPLAVCNAWLNGGAELAGRVSFGESDLLLSVPGEANWDFVIGCIPQVLRSDLAAGQLDKADPQALYDLSNYTAVQNVYEDHFGLGLIARLLDEVPEKLAPGARLLLNLAGRPGRAIIERMFSRRGFATALLFARRVKQAADTDIRPLVALETQTERAFEFFLEEHSAEPIRASTALGWLLAQNPIWHEVAVWEARLRWPRETLALRAALLRLGAQHLLREADLSRASHEQLDFAVALAQRLAASPTLPYTHEAGDPRFRAEVAQYLERFFGLSLSAEEIFVGPEREQTVAAVLRATCDPGDRVLVSKGLADTYARALSVAQVEVTVANDSLSEISRLWLAFDVKVLLLAVTPAERTNHAPLRRILDEAERRGVLVMLDESEAVNLTSSVEPHTLFEFLAREPHRANLVVLCGLLKNAVFPDFELTLLLPVPELLRQDLEVAAEVTYSRIGTVVQWFYERLFSELLNFRISFARSRPPRSRPPGGRPLPRSNRAQALAKAPCFAPKPFRGDEPQLLRLDYGENELPIPPTLVSGLLGACLGGEAEEDGLLRGVAAFLLETRGVRYAPAEIVAGQGVWPLIHDLAAALRGKLGRAPVAWAATPCYGVLPPTLTAAGCEVHCGSLADFLSSRAPIDLLVISQPGNPSGEFVDREMLLALASAVVERRCLLLSDEIFGLVNLSNPAAETVPSPASLELSVPGVAARTVVLGGLSKEFAAGGLRLGWAALRDGELAARLRATALGRVHRVAARAAASLYSAYRRDAAGKLLHPERHRALREGRAAQVRELGTLRSLLASALPHGSVDDPGSREQGGLFLFPRLAPLAQALGVAEAEVPAALYARTGVAINGQEWVGEPGRARMVFSLPRAKVEDAAARLRELSGRRS